ncbi:hypothetical protein [Flavihumibacter cheonanensis]
MTKQFSALNNTVIICGRNKETLLQAQWQVPGIHIYTCDLSIESDRLKLAAWLADNLQRHQSCSSFFYPGIERTNPTRSY